MEVIMIYAVCINYKQPNTDYREAESTSKLLLSYKNVGLIYFRK